MTRYLNLMLAFVLITPCANAQTITGAWQGKIYGNKVELKLVKKGDSLVGTSYYYASAKSFRRYSVKGYFDAGTNNVVWWDDELLEDNSGKGMARNGIRDPLLSVADFNCPGEEEMLLDGASNLKEDKDSRKKELHLQKIAAAQFIDEWDWVIENYTQGANDPYVIDSIASLRQTVPAIRDEELNGVVPKSMVLDEPASTIAINIPPPVAKDASANQDKFINRKKVLQTVIPVTSKKIELRFYDNAQIDGDSIALFLNGRMIFEHIRLTDEAYIVQLDVSSLEADNELVMVAENLGSIPPNTSFMVAIVDDKRYEARLYANENNSALIRLIKQ